MLANTKACRRFADPASVLMGAQNAYSCTKFVICSTGMVNLHTEDSDDRKVASVAQALLGQESGAF